MIKSFFFLWIVLTIQVVLRTCGMSRFANKLLEK
jgi:hypothetical protein